MFDPERSCSRGSTATRSKAELLDSVIEELSSDSRMVHCHHDPPRAAMYGELRSELPIELRDSMPVPQLWSHQCRAIDLLRDHVSVVLSTGTSSGKSLCYQVPAIEAALGGGCTLMLFPTKALAHDQLGSLSAWAPEGVTVAAYDGDCSPEERKWVRTNAHVVLTNPEMLHLGILANHRRWEDFLRRVRLVVVDELHVLRGVFGSHVAHVLRRLRRLVAALSGREPTFAFTSATVGEPVELAQRIGGIAVEGISEDHSPGGERTTLLWNPREAGSCGWATSGSTGPGSTGSSSTVSETARVAATLLRSGLRTLVFCRSRRSTELVANMIRTELARETGPQPMVPETVRAYRGGFLVEERRGIEQELADGSLRCVVSTSALELGIHVGMLDAAVLCGYPGSVSSLRQQLGRVGRGTRRSLAVMVAADDQLDQWLMRHPRELFRRTPEPAVINPSNRHVLLPHLGCAADELPLNRRDDAVWPDDLDDGVRDLVLQDRLMVHDSPGGPLAYWSGRGAPAHTVGLRSASRGAFSIRRRDGSLVGTVDAARVFDTVHPGAVYLHQGESWLVTGLDRATRTATVERSDGRTYTQVRSRSHIEVLEECESTRIGAMSAHLGVVEVTTQVTGYVTRCIDDHSLVARHELDLPSRTLTTTATWWVFPTALVQRSGVDEATLAGALHAAEHAAIGILPLFAICDRWDVGGLSSVSLPGTAKPTVMIHDAHPGGSGVTEMAFRESHRHVITTLGVLTDCPCEAGCPSCVQSPKCGSGNEPLDKTAAALILSEATAGTANAQGQQ